jgi:hypothetical protein
MVRMWVSIKRKLRVGPSYSGIDKNVLGGNQYQLIAIKLDQLLIGYKKCHLSIPI